MKFTFIICPDSPAAVTTIPACTREPQPGSIAIDLLGRFATRRATEPNALGYAEIVPEVGFRRAAGVFYDRVEELSRICPVQPASILGAVLAHEIGHLLLGSTAHTLSGIMTAHWTPKVLLALGQGQLLFSDSQARRIRANVIARNSRPEIYTLASARKHGAR